MWKRSSLNHALSLRNMSVHVDHHHHRKKFETAYNCWHVHRHHRSFHIICWAWPSSEASLTVHDTFECGFFFCLFVTWTYARPRPVRRMMLFLWINFRWLRIQFVLHMSSIITIQQLWTPFPHPCSRNSEKAKPHESLDSRFLNSKDIPSYQLILDALQNLCSLSIKPARNRHFTVRINSSELLSWRSPNHVTC